MGKTNRSIEMLVELVVKFNNEHYSVQYDTEYPNGTEFVEVLSFGGNEELV